MKTRYMRALKGFIAFVLTLAGLYVGQAVWQNYAVDLPLDKALSGINGIKKVSWNSGSSINDEITIHVELDNTADLRKAYSDINEKSIQILKGRQYALEIKDDRTPELEEIYYDIHYHIQKAVADGNFPLLNETVQEKAKSAGAVSKLYVDEKNIYLQLTKNGHSLYSIVTRSTSRIGGSL